MPIPNPRRTTPGAAALLAATAATAALFATAACHVATDPADSRDDPARAASSGDRGAFLYHRLCAGCHGLRGAADALPAGTLAPEPRDFSAGLFKLASTTNGIPTDGDLRQCIGRGMPGTAMPGFAWLGEADLDSLVRYTRALAISELAQRLVREAVAIGDRLTEPAALAHATEALTPGAPVLVPKSARPSPAVLARGKHLFLTRCAACHGEVGTGQRPIASWAGRLTIQWARDFRAGVFKGPISDAALAHRIQAGMPASAMPPNTFTDPDELAAVIAYTRSLIPEGAGDRLVQTRQTVTAQRSQAPAPLDHAHPAWRQAPVSRVVLSPFVWREESIVGCDLQAIHDGEHLSLRLTWEDKTRDAPLPGAGGFADAVALEFSDAAVPVFFGMGSRRHPVHIWYWKPLTGKQLAGDLDRNGRLPGGSRADVPIDAGVAGRPPQRAVALVAHGHVSAQAFGSQDRTITADARWRDGRWTVLLRRKLAPGDPEQIAFTPGSTLQLALAIWNGSTAQRHTDKSFTIWHELRLE